MKCSSWTWGEKKQSEWKPSEDKDAITRAGQPRCLPLFAAGALIMVLMTAVSWLLSSGSSPSSLRGGTKRKSISMFVYFSPQTILYAHETLKGLDLCRFKFKHSHFLHHVHRERRITEQQNVADSVWVCASCIWGLTVLNSTLDFNTYKKN